MTTTTRITTPFGRETTAEEIVAGLDLGGRRAVVTGATSGIGAETARVLASVGVAVTLAVRNTDAGERTATEIREKTGNDAVAVSPLDLADRASVAAFVAAWRGPLHMLVNNAGVMALSELQRTADGWEYQFATNHLGHMALTLGLYAPLAAGSARVVAVSSDAHAHSRAPIEFDDIHFQRRPYNPFLGYSQSKTANVLFAVELNRRWAEDGITGNALHPGGIRTRLQRHVEAMDRPPEQKAAMDKWPWRSAEQGAATTVLLAASPLLEGVGGRYFENCNEAVPYYPDNPPAEPDAPGVAAYAVDPEAAARLWQISLEMLAG